MAASLKGVFRSLKLLVEQNPTVITACGTAASFYAGWLGHSARQKHQAELEQMIVRLQDRLREVRTSEDPYSGVSLITKSFLDWKYLFSITVPMSLASAGVCLLLGYRTGVPVGIAAARAAIPSTEKELNRIRSRARILVLHSRRHMHRRENEHVHVSAVWKAVKSFLGWARRKIRTKRYRMRRGNDFQNNERLQKLNRQILEP